MGKEPKFHLLASMGSALVSRESVVVDRKHQRTSTFDAMESNVETNLETKGLLSIIRTTNGSLPEGRGGGLQRSRGRSSPKYLVTLETPLILPTRAKLLKTMLDNILLYSFAHESFHATETADQLGGTSSIARA